MRYLMIYLTLFIGGVLLLTINLFQSQTTIKYFPFDENVTFIQAKTELSLLEESNNQYNIDWETLSKTSEDIYLRQDLSLLFVDGQLKSFQSKWLENEEDITLKAIIPGEGSSHYQAITYHHGEIHYPKDEIRSNYKMTEDSLYVIDSEHTPLFTFKEAISDEQTTWKETLDHATSQQLHYHWHQLMNHFQLDFHEYLFVPLTELHRYETEDLPNLSETQRKKIIAQLWEGLYANYVLPFKQSDSHETSYIPLILFNKNGDHLYVLFQDQNGQMQKLVQTYSVDPEN